MFKLALLVALLPVAVQAVCTYGTIAAGKPLCYRPAYDWKMNFADARSFCHWLGGELASVHDQGQMYALHWSTYDDFWLGLSDQNDQDQWKWLDGSPLNQRFMPWAAGQPSRKANRDCGIANGASMLWAAEDCAKKANFLCELPFDNPMIKFTPPNCPKDALCYDGHVYTASDRNGTYEEVERSCQAKNGHLASIHSIYEQFIVGALCAADYVKCASNDGAWIGGIKPANVQQRARWTDGTPMDFIDPLSYAGMNPAGDGGVGEEGLKLLYLGYGNAWQYTSDKGEFGPRKLFGYCKIPLSAV